MCPPSIPCCVSQKALRVACWDEPGEEGDVRLVTEGYDELSDAKGPLQVFHDSFWMGVVGNATSPFTARSAGGEAIWGCLCAAHLV